MSDTHLKFSVYDLDRGKQGILQYRSEFPTDEEIETLLTTYCKGTAIMIVNRDTGDRYIYDKNNGRVII